MATKKKRKKASLKKKAKPKTKAKKKLKAKRKKITRKARAVKARSIKKQLMSGDGIAVGVLRPIGEITHYFRKVSAGVLRLIGSLRLGDMILVKGHTTNFRQKVDSMQIDHVPIKEAKRGQEIGLKVVDRVRVGDTVYKLS